MLYVTAPRVSGATLRLPHLAVKARTAGAVIPPDPGPFQHEPGGVSAAVAEPDISRCRTSGLIQRQSWISSRLTSTGPRSGR